MRRLLARPRPTRPSGPRRMVPLGRDVHCPASPRLASQLPSRARLTHQSILADTTQAKAATESGRLLGPRPLPGMASRPPRLGPSIQTVTQPLATPGHSQLAPGPHRPFAMFGDIASRRQVDARHASAALDGPHHLGGDPHHLDGGPHHLGGGPHRRSTPSRRRPHASRTRRALSRNRATHRRKCARPAAPARHRTPQRSSAPIRAHQRLAPRPATISVAPINDSRPRPRFRPRRAPPHAIGARQTSASPPEGATNASEHDSPHSQPPNTIRHTRSPRSRMKRGPTPKRSPTRYTDTRCDAAGRRVRPRSGKRDCATVRGPAPLHGLD